ncbi:MAG: phage tail sheath subtilisin-like domain-containing protein [Nitrososphaerales archaeon]
MAVFLSPGVFPREIDLSVLPTAVGPIRPVFIGTAKKGPINTPTFVSNAQQFIDIFGEPIKESPLGFAVLNYMEEGNQAWILRVGVEAEEGQPAELAAIAIDTSGKRIQGWGRIPVFKGIDHGRIRFRKPTADAPFEFHDDAVFDIDFNDIDVSPTDGPTTATLDFTPPPAGVSDTYLGAIDDSFIVLITEGPSASSGSVMDGAKFQIIRNSDGKVVNSGVINESATPGVSDPINVGVGSDDNGLKFVIVVTGTSPLEANDSFTFKVRPDNKTFSVSVQGGTANSYTFGNVTFTDTNAFVDALNALIGSGEDYIAQNVDGFPELVTKDEGHRIQLMSTSAFALEVGVNQYVYDIPRSHLVSNDPGPYNITSSNNRVKISAIEEDTTTNLEISIPDGLGQDTNDIAEALDDGSIYLGKKYFDAFSLQVAANEYRVAIVASDTAMLATLKMQANFSNPKTLRFAQELDIPFPYFRNYRGFYDPRVALPTPGEVTPSVPLSCEVDPGSDECAADSAYYQNIVGWLVAKTPGTWVDTLRVALEHYNEDGDRYTLRIFDRGVEVDRTENISFDPRDPRYIANVLNAGSALGGANGNPYVEWESRPAFLNNDPSDASTFEVRNPTPFSSRLFSGQANGIPTSVEFSSELDRAIIGNPATSTGMFAFQNPEVFDVNLLAIPGVSSGAVIGQALQLCEGRGDMLFIVDPPFGLRPQQVVDWHNGMLFSDLRAAINSSYGALYWPWLKIFNQFDGSEIFVPPSGFVCGVFSRTARVREQWFAPAGLNRGHLLTALDVEFNATQGERDLLYGSGNAINPIVKFPVDGITVFGQRTLQRKQSALDRVNVRMLLIFLKKNLTRLLRFFLFEPIDRLLFAEVRAAITPFLEDVMARRGLQAFKVICDETNNTPERIDRNELHVSVLLKPTRAAEFIVLNLVIMRTEQSFAAEEVLAAAGVVGNNA